MLYLGIDQHKRQLTVNLRGEDGSVVLKRQVSTEWEKVRAFFADLGGRKGDTHNRRGVKARVFGFLDHDSTGTERG